MQTGTGKKDKDDLEGAIRNMALIIMILPAIAVLFFIIMFIIDKSGIRL